MLLGWLVKGVKGGGGNGFIHWLQVATATCKMPAKDL